MPINSLDGRDKPIVVSLFDESGNMVRPWAEAGFVCHCWDIQNDHRHEAFDNGGLIWYGQADLRDNYILQDIADTKPVIVFGFPPCTDLAVSGAKHFATKRAANPDFQYEAATLALAVSLVAKLAGNVPYMVENPVGVLGKFWRKPDHYFHPYEYGGYLPKDDVHPRWPQYIRPQDAYPKKTCIWSGNGFVMPPKIPVEVPPGWKRTTEETWWKECQDKANQK